MNADPRRLRVSVLFHETDGEDGSPEHDVAVDQVAGAREAGGHEARLLPVRDDLRRLIDGLERHVAAVLELLGRPFTGTGATGMTLRGDKSIAKKILTFHEAPTPQYAIVEEKSIELVGKTTFPLFVKPLRADGSVGIDQDSLVRDLIRQIDVIHREVGDAALVEEYIEGRELYVGILGNDPMEALPLIELDFSRLPDGYHPIYDRAAKAEGESVRYQAIREIAAIDLTPEVRSRITTIGLAAARAMQVTDYAGADPADPGRGRPALGPRRARSGPGPRRVQEVDVRIVLAFSAS